MEHPLFRTSSNYDYLSERGEISVNSSLTRPEQSLSIKELYSRWTNGQSLDVVHNRGLDWSDEDFDSYDPLNNGDTDLVDYYERMMYEADELQRRADIIENEKVKQRLIDAANEKQRIIDEYKASLNTPAD